MKKTIKVKKLSLQKLQMVKINNGLNTIRGGSEIINTGNTEDTIFDKTQGPKTKDLTITP